jgi:hypothetical protein
MGEPQLHRPANPLGQAPPAWQCRHHHAGPPTSPSAGADGPYPAEPTTARSNTMGHRHVEAAPGSRQPSPVTGKRAGKGATTPPYHAPDRSWSSSRRHRIWEEPELCSSPCCQIAGEWMRMPHQEAAMPARDTEDEPPTTTGSRRKPRLLRARRALPPPFSGVGFVRRTPSAAAGGGSRVGGGWW